MRIHILVVVVVTCVFNGSIYKSAAGIHIPVVMASGGAPSFRQLTLLWNAFMYMTGMEINILVVVVSGGGMSVRCRIRRCKPSLAALELLHIKFTTEQTSLTADALTGKSRNS